MAQRKRSHRPSVAPPIPELGRVKATIEPATPRIDSPPPTIGKFLLAAGIILIAAVLVYGNSFGSPFIFDGRIVRDNSDFHAFWPPMPLLRANNRPLAVWSFACNYAIHGLDVRGYHATNLAIHVLAAWVLYGIVVRTLKSPMLGDRYGERAEWMALAAALLWVVHPLQTESVTYIYQRFESLMGLFFLLSVYTFTRGSQSRRPIGWYALSILCCVASLACKEVAAMIPAVILWYDRVFVASNWREIFRRRGPYYAVMAGLFLFLAVMVLTHHDYYRQGNVLCWDQISSWQYAASQAGVILHYLQLSIWPQGLCLDYDWKVARRVLDVVPQVLTVGALLALLVAAMFRRPKWSFLGGWFFLILTPTSSIVPVADLAFEHRMYLPLAAVTVAVVILGHNLPRYLRMKDSWQDGYRRLSVAMLVAGVMALGITTYARNEAYVSELAMWQDVVQKAPRNGRARASLGKVLLARGDEEGARACFLESVRVYPYDFEVCVRIGTMASSPDEAIYWYRRALEIYPEAFNAINNLGVTMLRLDRPAEAVGYFRRAVKLQPDNPTFHHNLSQGLAAQGRFEEAMAEYRAARQRSPGLTPPAELAAWMEKQGIYP